MQTRRFGSKTAVDNVNLKSRNAPWSALSAALGAGKSTLLRMINRLIDSSEGSIASTEVEVSALADRRCANWRAIAPWIFQQFNLVPRLDVMTNVLLGLLEPSLNSFKPAGSV